MRNRFLARSILRSPATAALVALSAVALSAGVATTNVSAQPAEDSLTRIRVDGSRARRVGTVLRIAPDSAIVRLLYTEHQWHAVPLTDWERLPRR